MRLPRGRSLRRSGLLQFPAKAVGRPFLLERTSAQRTAVAGGDVGDQLDAVGQADRQAAERPASRRPASSRPQTVNAALAVEHLAGPQVALGTATDVGPPAGRCAGRLAAQRGGEHRDVSSSPIRWYGLYIAA